ncbi:hypothetical protein E6C27_scaffold366G00810 [Cucumis melo var. makuwa]|uniref:Uncharacterized protein n=1 Tax=Cucumis melo var. makuwa TaxID=1194695 RepID=A0A5A7TDE1_CUCMM|nr:hypothetical protein E6C27_scaffold366G00810 [Cucumis melo var. makuwa]
MDVDHRGSLRALEYDPCNQPNANGHRSRLQQWSPSVVSRLKLNVVVACHLLHDKFGVGIVIRNDKRRLVTVTSLCKVGSLNVEVGGVMALLKELRFIGEGGFLNNVIGMDVEVVVK